MEGLYFRCVTAVLQVNKRPPSRVHLVSCYAPTGAASREEKGSSTSLRVPFPQ